MSYERVIPRDLFNESSLLKCYGRLYILTEGNPHAAYLVDSVPEFEVVQREDDGRLYVDNLPFTIHGKKYRLTRPLNSLSAWPLYAERSLDLDFEEIPVFTNDGELSPEILALIG